MSKSPRPASRRGRVVAVALLLATLPIHATGAAQPAGPPGGTIRVTAGEHGEFSRVVFVLGAGHSYRTEPEPAGLRVVFPDALVGFEYAEVYPKRRAHRVTMAQPALNADGASLRLRFGCDCSVRTFTLGAKLVVDVFDAASTAPEPARSGRARQAQRIGAPPAVSDRRAGGAADGMSPPAAPGASTGESNQGQPRAEFLRRVESLGDPEPRAARPATAPDGAGFDPEHLQRMLAWAIDQGHLSSAAEDDQRSPPAPHPEGAAAPTASAAVPPSTTTTVANAGATPPASQEDTGEAGPATSCPDGSALDMAALGGEGTFAAELARRQDALSRVLAADHGISEAQHALVGFYLARLMPQEALAVLGEVEAGGAVPPTRVWLRAAALVLADRPDEVAASVVRSSSCQSADAQLWHAVISAARGPVPQGILESDAVLLRLAAYPADLRVELGLRLAESGITAKAPEAIAQLLDLVEQAGPAEEARARLLFLRGRLAASRGDFAGARASWRGAAGLPGEGGLRAMLALVESDLERGEVDEVGALFELERLAYDWRGHPLQLRVARLTAAIHERRGRLSDALAALEEVALDAAGRPNGRAAARLATDLMRRAYADAPATLPIEGLAAFWRFEGFVPPGAEGADVRIAMARALIGQSLPGPAIQLLEPVARDADGAVADEAIDLLAEGYLAVNQPPKALDLLRAAARAAPGAKPGRNLLAARALAALERFAEAAGVLDGNTGDETARLQADYLWKAGLWKEAAAAYRELLRHDWEQGQVDAARQAAIRLAAAAYMAKQPKLVVEASRVAEAAGEDYYVSAFAPMPNSGASARTRAAQSLEQARALGKLAERYGLRGQETP